MKKLIPLILLQLIIKSFSNSVAKIDFTKNVVDTTSYLYSNFIGLSNNFDEMLPQFNRKLYQDYILNSNIYGDWQSNFGQVIHMPVGYMYNCSIVNNTLNNTNCTYELAGKSKTIKNIGGYIYNVTNSYSMTLGWNMQNSNFSDNLYMRNFSRWYMDIYTNSSYQIWNVELADKVDQFGALDILQNYSLVNYTRDLNLIQNSFYGILVIGPGVTEKASSIWYDAIDQINTNYFSIFSFRCTVFLNTSQATIQNLLSDNYTKGYLQRRFTINGINYYQDFSRQYVAINDIRLVQDPAGIDGITNSFAAAIWAIDVAMEWAIMGGYSINFYNPLDIHSFQSILGQSPTFSPSQIFSGLLFSILCNYRSPGIQLPNVVQGLSKNIKVYGLQSYSNYGILMINKDTNTSLKGTIDITLPYLGGLNCVYLQAPSLSATSGIKFGNLTFVANDSTYTGSWESFNYYINEAGIYQINISYAQVVLCNTIDKTASFDFPKGRSSQSQSFLVIASYLFILILVLI